MAGGDLTGLWQCDDGGLYYIRQEQFSESVGISVDFLSLMERSIKCPLIRDARTYLWCLEGEALGTFRLSGLTACVPDPRAKLWRPD